MSQRSPEASPGFSAQSINGRLGAAILHSKYDSRELTANARAAFMVSFEAKVDPDGTLPAAERRRRAEHLRQAHFIRMGKKSAKVRAARAKRRNGGAT